MVKYAVLGALLVGVAACQDSTSPRATAESPSRLPAGVNASQGAAQNDYIVTLRDDEPDPDGQVRRDDGIRHAGQYGGQHSMSAEHPGDRLGSRPVHLRQPALCQRVLDFRLERRGQRRR